MPIASILGSEGSHGLLRWPIPEEFVSSPAVAYRNRFAVALSQRSVTKIVESFVYLSAGKMDRLVKIACRAVDAAPLRGIGLELGSGCGLLSAIIARQPQVEAMLAVEVCEESAGRLVPKVASSILNGQREKVVPVVGSFDDLRLPADSIDFIVEIDSFHHSDDLVRTFGECHRVLKPGGRVLCLDRCHPNHISDAEVDEMLSQVYSKRFLTQNFYPPDVILTRRENGEHEYRLFEWENAFRAAGLRLHKARRLMKEVPAVKAVKGCLSLFPSRLRRMLYQTDNATFRTTFEWLTQPFRALSTQTEFGHPVFAPKETTVFLLEKPATR
jgi:SAM-dependent methyltransferase